ncbi:MAG: DUF1847 domain-containing protein [Desulfotomaculales bacterium]
MSNCANCGVFACRDGRLETAPSFCPAHASPEILAEAAQEYNLPATRDIARRAAEVEAAGYGRWTRLEEIIEFARRSGFQKLGLAFCTGLRKEAAQVAKIFTGAGFTVFSAACKTGALPKEALGLKEEEKVRPGEFEAACNPVAQAKILNAAGTELNILLGLCVGHDTLFFRHTSAPATVLAVKDRVLAHNPLGALWAEHYYAEKIAAHARPVPPGGTAEETAERIKDELLKAASGGRISCTAAHRLAGRLGVPPFAVGAACNELKIKIKGCELGCFK